MITIFIRQQQTPVDPNDNGNIFDRINSESMGLEVVENEADSEFYFQFLCTIIDFAVCDWVQVFKYDFFKTLKLLKSIDNNFL